MEWSGHQAAMSRPLINDYRAELRQDARLNR
jgi:hypothetical protein